jgi:hypothetical protein
MRLSVTATFIIAFLPKLGRINNKKIAVMAGLSPLNRDKRKNPWQAVY